MGLVPGTPWQLGQVALGQSQTLTLKLSCPSFLGSVTWGWGAAWALSPSPPQRLIGHRLPGALPPLPLKGALYHHKEALSLQEKPGCCHGYREGLGRRGSTMFEGERAFQAEGTGVHGPVWVMAALPSCGPQLG